MIRNFAIIAHIDAGKTTLTDRFLQLTHTVTDRDFHDRLLDANPIEQERGVTIKLAPVTMQYQLPEELKKIFNFSFCTLNLIDTPGHVDFAYEVERSLAACEGAVLLIDATKGIQAQTLSHAHKAVSLGLTLIPAINKIDLESANVNRCLTQLNQIFGFKPPEVSLVSAKTGQGVPELLARIITDIPAPQGAPTGALRALIFNSVYDDHLGVIAFVRVVDGQVTTTDPLILLQTHHTFTPKEIGIFTPPRQSTPTLATGQVGYIATGLKDICEVHIGDTITQKLKIENYKLKIEPLPGYKEPQPVVFADAYPGPDTSYQDLITAVAKLKLSDASLFSQPIHSTALGPGVRLGFLGLFHIDITQERLVREHHIHILLTPPTVAYHVTLTNDTITPVTNPKDLPDPSAIKVIREPMVQVSLLTLSEYLGPVMQLLQDHRGSYQTTNFLSDQAQLIYHLPLSELISGLIDQIKSVSHGYASLDYEPIAPQPVQAVKLDILLNHQPIATLARIVVISQADRIGRELVERLKELLPAHQFAVPIQATVGARIIARATKPALRKDVTAKLYGGDQTRKDKLLKKQKKGKKLLAQFGRVTIPESVFTRLATTA